MSRKTRGEPKADASVFTRSYIVQVGGGTRGVEMAGTIAEMARMAPAEDFRHIDLVFGRFLLPPVSKQRLKFGPCT